MDSVVATGTFRKPTELLLDGGQLRHVFGKAAGVAEHVLGAQEQARAGMAAAGKDEAGSGVARGRRSPDWQAGDGP